MKPTSKYHSSAVGQLKAGKKYGLTFAIAVEETPFAPAVRTMEVALV